MEYLLTLGSSDPSKEISEYAIKMVGASAYEELALGGGKQDVAVALLRKAAAQGTWVCLKNLHLVTHWLPVLEKEVTAFLTASTDTNRYIFPSIFILLCVFRCSILPVYALIIMY